jgi:hypothetical protein
MPTSICRSALVLTAVIAAAACSSDSSSAPKQAIAPDGASCTTGVLATNGTPSTGTITSNNCALYSTYDDDSGPAASYAINLTAGRLYQVRDSLPASIQGSASLVLVGKSTTDTSTHVVLAEAVSEEPNNEDGIWFYALTTGTYSLRVASTDTADHNVPYSVNAVSCPIVATVAAADTVYGDSASTIGTTGCTELFSFWGSPNDSSVVNYYVVQFSAGQTRNINVYSSAFTAGWYLGGPGFNSMDDVDGGNDEAGDGQAANTFTALESDSAGAYTLAVGSDPYGGTGSYALTILPTSLVPASRVPSGAPRAVTHLSQRQRVHIVR